jgi:hypothetical protein
MATGPEPTGPSVLRSRPKRSPVETFSRSSNVNWPPPLGIGRGVPVRSGVSLFNWAMLKTRGAAVIEVIAPKVLKLTRQRVITPLDGATRPPGASPPPSATFELRIVHVFGTPRVLTVQSEGAPPDGGPTAVPNVVAAELEDGMRSRSPRISPSEVRNFRDIPRRLQLPAAAT